MLHSGKFNSSITIVTNYLIQKCHRRCILLVNIVRFWLCAESRSLFAKQTINLPVGRINETSLWRLLFPIFPLSNSMARTFFGPLRGLRDLNLASNIASRTVEIQNTDRCAALVCNVFLDIIFSLITIKKTLKVVWNFDSFQHNVCSFTNLDLSIY